MTKWYAASIVMLVKFKDGNQDIYPVWENIILIEAASEDEAFIKAETRGREDEGDSNETYTYDNRPATLEFSGIRKLIECVDPDERPGDGTEVTYSRFLIDGAESFSKFLEGDELTLLYEE